MTISELATIPKGMDLNTYSQLLDKRKKLWHRMSRLTDVVRDCNDAMWALDGEIGSDRWKRWSERKEKALKDLDKANEEFDAVNLMLRR